MRPAGELLCRYLDISCLVVVACYLETTALHCRGAALLLQQLRTGKYGPKCVDFFASAGRRRRREIQSKLGASYFPWGRIWTETREFLSIRRSRHESPAPAVENFAWLPVGTFSAKTGHSPDSSIVDLNKTASGTFFREVHPGSEMASQNDQNKAK